MHSMTCLLILAIANFQAIDALKMEDFFTEVKPAFPPLSERETLPGEQVRELQRQWEEAQKTGLLKDRHDIWSQLGTVDFSKYWSWYLKYNNKEIIDIVLEMTYVEYDCYKKYRTETPKERFENMEQVRCIAERKPQGEDDEFELDYNRYISGIAISTLAPEIFDIVLSAFFSSSRAAEDYYLTHNVEGHLEAMLNGKLENSLLWYRYCNVRKFISLTSDELIICMLIKYPELGWKYRDKVFALIEATINSKSDRVARHARRLKRCMDIIVSEYEKIEGESQVKVEGER